MKNKAFGLARILLLGGILLLSLSLGQARAEAEFSTSEFSLTIPDGFEQIGNQSALLVLRNKVQGFPTFNAVLSPGSWPHVKLSVADQALRLVDEYRAVGLKNTQVLESAIRSIDGRDCLYARLSYHLNDALFSSEIWLLSLADRHLIFTAVYQGQVSDAEKDKVRAVIEEIKIKAEVAQLKRKSVNWVIFAIPLLVAILVLLFYLNKRKNPAI